MPLITEQDLINFFELSQEFFCIAGTDGYFKKVNLSFCKALGYSEAEMLSRPFIEFVHPEDLKPSMVSLDKIGNEVQITNSEFRYICKDGSSKWLSWNGTRPIDSPFIYSSARDITYQKEIEHQKNKLRDRLATILANFTEGYFNLSKDWIIIDYNPAAEKLSKISGNELKSACFWDIFKEAPVSFIELNKCLRDNTPVRYEEFSPRISRWIEVIAYPYDNALTLFFHDITEKKTTEKELRTGNERYNLVNRATNDAIYDWDIVNDRLIWGGGYERLFGYDNCNSCLEEWSTRVHPQDFTPTADSLQETLTNPLSQYWHSEYRFKKICGGYAYIIEDGYVLRDETGKAVRMVGALHDVSKLKENEERVMRQNETLKQIAQINSHEMRKPIANILGLLDILESPETENSRELLRMLRYSGVELDEIVRDIAKKALI